MTQPPPSPEDIHTAVARGFADQTRWLERLAAFDSTRGNEAACQAWLAQEFATRGYGVDSYRLDEVDLAGLPGHSPVVDADYSRAVQVVATHDPAGARGRSLILMGHIDVVPTGAPELWDQDPFTPQIRDGWMTGRGTGDMKAGVSALVFALDALRALGWEPDARVHLQTVSEEECTGNGALSTLARGYRAEAAFIPESMGHRLIRAELGSVWFRLRILGQPGHMMTGAASVGGHAILAAYEYIKDLAALTAAFNLEAQSHPHFAHIPDPVKFNPGRIHGGDWLGSVPSWCELDCRISVLPGHPLPEVRARVAAAIAACAARLAAPEPVLSWIGFQADGHVFAPGSAAETTLAGIHQEIIGSPLEAFSMTATSDTRFYDLYYDIPALCYGGHARGMHSPQEGVDLASLERTTEIIARFIAEWCGLRPVA